MHIFIKKEDFEYFLRRKKVDTVFVYSVFRIMNSNKNFTLAVFYECLVEGKFFTFGQEFAFDYDFSSENLKNIEIKSVFIEERLLLYIENKMTNKQIRDYFPNELSSKVESTILNFIQIDGVRVCFSIKRKG